MAPLPTSLHSKQSSLSAPPAMVSAAAPGTLGSEAATSGEGTASRAGGRATHQGSAGVGKRIFPQNSLAQHWARDWRALALTQGHHRSRLSDSCEDGEALSSVHPTALVAGKLIHNLLCDGRVKND